MLCNACNLFVGYGLLCVVTLSDCIDSPRSHHHDTSSQQQSSIPSFIQSTESSRRHHYTYTHEKEIAWEMDKLRQKQPMRYDRWKWGG